MTKYNFTLEEFKERILDSLTTPKDAFDIGKEVGLGIDTVLKRLRELENDELVGRYPKRLGKMIKWYKKEKYIKDK